MLEDNQPLLRRLPGITNDVNKKVFILYTALVFGGIGVALLWSFSTTNEPGSNPNMKISWPEGIEIPRKLRGLPTGYDTNNVVTAEITKPTPTDKSPKKDEEASSVGMEMLKKMERLERQLEGLSSKTNSQVMNISRDLSESNSDFKRGLKDIKIETMEFVNDKKETLAKMEMIQKEIEKSRQLISEKNSIQSGPTKEQLAVEQEVNNGAILFNLTAPTLSSDMVMANDRETTKGDAEKDSSNHPTVSGVDKKQQLFEIKMGTVIPATLVTAIDSSLAGQLTAQVRENVYDSLTGKYLLLPQGAKLVGSYKSILGGSASRRLDVDFTHILRSDGVEVALGDSESVVDNAGATGLSGEVDNHWGQLAIATLLTAAYSVGFESNDYWRDQALNDAGRTFGNHLAERLVPEGPTIHIKPGYRFNIFVGKSIQLPVYFDP